MNVNFVPEKGYKRIAILALYIAISCGMVYIFFAYILELIFPFVIAWFLTLMIQPLISLVSKGTKISRKVLSVVLVLLIIIVLCAAIYFIFNRIFIELGEIIEKLNDNADYITDTVNKYTKKIPFLNLSPTAQTDFIKNTIAAVTSKIPEIIGAVISALPNTIFFGIILLMASFYICVDFKNINNFIALQLPGQVTSFILEIKKRLKSTGFKYLRAYMLMLLITFVQLLVGFMILKIDYSFTLAMIIAVIDILPVLGVGTVLIPWGLIEIISGNYFVGFGFLIIFAISTLIRQLIEPRIIGISLGLNALVTLISMYVGLKLFGFAGIFILPICVIIIKNFNDDGIIKLWKIPEKNFTDK